MSPSPVPLPSPETQRDFWKTCPAHHELFKEQRWIFLGFSCTFVLFMCGGGPTAFSCTSHRWLWGAAGPGDAEQGGQTAQPVGPGKSSEVTSWPYPEPHSPPVLVSPCGMLPAETQPHGSTELCLQMTARGGWMLLTLLCQLGSALQEVNLEGAVTHRALWPCSVSQEVALSPATLPLLLLPCPLSVSGV